MTRPTVAADGTPGQFCTRCGATGTVIDHTDGCPAPRGADPVGAGCPRPSRTGGAVTLTDAPTLFDPDHQAEVPATLAERAEAWIRANPAVVQRFASIALDLHRRGERMGAKAIAEGDPLAARHRRPPTAVRRLRDQQLLRRLPRPPRHGAVA